MNAEIDVTMTWSQGEWDVGIPAGWEECFVDIVFAGTYRTCFSFRPGDGPVREWPVEEVQVNLILAQDVQQVYPGGFHRPTGWLGAAFDEDGPKNAMLHHPTTERYAWGPPKIEAEHRQLVLGDLPLLCDAVEEHWEKLLEEQRAADEAEARYWKEHEATQP